MRRVKRELPRKPSGEVNPIYFEVEADAVIVAIGNKPNPLIPRTSPSLKTTRWGTIEVNEETLETDMPGVFAGGDVVSGAATVISAMGQGKTAARSIHRYLMGADPPESDASTDGDGNAQQD